jgi:hypothetical protein
MLRVGRVRTHPKLQSMYNPRNPSAVPVKEVQLGLQ